MNTKQDQEARLRELENNGVGLVAFVRDFATSDVASASEGYTTRSFNKVFDPFGLGIALDGGNGFKLPPGKWLLEARSMHYRARHKVVQFYNVTGGANTLLNVDGDSSLYFNQTTDDSVASAHENHILEVTSTMDIEVRVYTEQGTANGLSGGVLNVPEAGSNGSIVCEVKITKIG